MRDARAAAPAEANGLLREALSLWRGRPLAEFAYESWAQPEIERLEELRLEALRERIETDLALGASAELVGELELLVGQYPLRERLRAQLMLALYRSGRQADALEAYRDARRALVESLGIEPTLTLRQLERRILDQDPALELVVAEPPAAGAARPWLSLQGRSSSFVGRTRAPLDVPEERVYQVPALELPGPSRHTSIAQLRRTEAVRLFVDRARVARPDFELSETNAESVAELCVRLDGLPLALELAAARCNLLPPRALLERLDSRLDLLRAAPGSGLTERQWTLRGAIEWSCELLDPREQQLFTSLGVVFGSSMGIPGP